MVNTNRHTLMEYYRQWHMLPVDTDINPIAYIKENKILREQCFNYLLTSVDNDAPRYSEDYQILLGRSCADDKWRPKTTENALQYLEEYALNVFKYPWKREYSSLKLYTGFYYTRICSYIPDAEDILQRIGYRRSVNNCNVLDLCNDARDNYEGVLSMAFSLWLLQSECEIIVSIYKKLVQRISETDNCIGLYHDIHRCRASATTLSGIDDCIQAVLRRRCLQPAVAYSSSSISPLPSSQQVKAPVMYRDNSTSPPTHQHRHHHHRNHRRCQCAEEFPVSERRTRNTSERNKEREKKKIIKSDKCYEHEEIDIRGKPQVNVKNTQKTLLNPNDHNLKSVGVDICGRGPEDLVDYSECVTPPPPSPPPKTLPKPAIPLYSSGTVNDINKSPSGVFTSTPRPYSSIKPVLRRMNSNLGTLKLSPTKSIPCSPKGNSEACDPCNDMSTPPRDVCLNKTIRPKACVGFAKQLVISEYDIVAQSSPDKFYSLIERPKRLSIYENVEDTTFVS